MSSLPEARIAAGADTAALSDGETAYHLAGDDGPWVVLVHGLITPSFAWEPLAEALAQNGFRVLRYDEFGRGLSARPRLRYDLDLYVRQLRELTDALGIEQMHVVSWSMGALIATRFAAENADRVTSLAFIAPGLFMESSGLVQKISRLPVLQRLVAWRVSDVVDRLPAQHLSRPDRFPDYTARASEQLAFPGVGASFASTVAYYPLRAGAQWRVVSGHPRPVLVVWGDDDRVVPYANASRVLDLYPGAELVTVEGGKHAPHLDHAGIVAPAILRHLTRAAGRG